MSNKKYKLFGRVIGIISLVAVLLATAWVILNRQYVLDQFTVWSFTPSSAIATINQRSGFTEKGTFYFYTSKPEVAPASQFNNSCIRQEVTSAILGCYSNKQIYIYDIPNDELDGVEEVTAAHETLHAVWDRLSLSEQESLVGALQVAFSKIDDPKLNERMAYYERTQPGERYNELHSILGTEFRNLGPTLEAHYAQYFTDRTIIIGLHDAYQAIFDNLKAQSDALSEELGAMKTSIDAKTKQYNTEAASITNTAADLQISAGLVDTTSSAQVNAYNAKRQVLLNRIDALENLRSQINGLSDTYNVKVAEYNTLAVSSNELNKSLDSTLAPAPSL